MMPVQMMSAPGEVKRPRKPPKRVSHLKRPEGLSLEAWQIVLRRQLAAEQPLRIKNAGAHPIFSTFEVTNPQTAKTYRVVIRGEALGINYCSCPDFSVNTLGTCKHIESVLHRLRRKAGAQAALRAGYRSPHSSVTLRYGLQRRAALSLGRAASPALRQLAAEFFDAEGVLTPQGFQQFDEFIARAKSLPDDVRYHPDAMAFIASVRDTEVRRARISRMFPHGIHDERWGLLLRAELYPYQKTGALFAASAGRCLIADDMGLGKTLQAIAASEILAQGLGVEKVLILCPASLKHQWQREIEQFTARPVRVIQGSWPQRQRQYQAATFFMIANYDLVHSDRAAMAAWTPDLIILDEAQRIKNWRTRLARAVKQLPSPYAFVLTGTPLENRLEELHSIVEFIDWYHLGPLFRLLDRHQVVDEGGKVVGYKNLQKLGESLQTIMIRRKREEVLPELPPRIEKHCFVPLTEAQRTIHADYQELVARLVQKWRRHHFLTEEDKQRLMRALQAMRMVCDSTYLLDPRTKHGQKVEEIEAQLRDVLEEPEVKVVVFSQWLRMMELIIARLKANGWRHAFLHGGLPSNRRGACLETFRDDPACRVLLCTEVGGVGLNLQQAAVVINVDLPWNPAILEQRISRVHRMGQPRAVRVIHFIAEGGIEHGILDLLKFKRSMFSGVLDRGDDEVYLGTTRFNQFMQTVERASAVVEQKAGRGPLLPETGERERTLREGPAKGQASDQTAQAAPSLRTILQWGASFFEQLSRSLEEPAGGSASAETSSQRLSVRTDPQTGKRTLQIPLPDEDTLNHLMATVGQLLSLRKSGNDSP